MNKVLKKLRFSFVAILLLIDFLRNDVWFTVDSKSRKEELLTVSNLSNEILYGNEFLLWLYFHSLMIIHEALRNEQITN